VLRRRSKVRTPSPPTNGLSPDERSGTAKYDAVVSHVDLAGTAHLDQLFISFASAEQDVDVPPETPRVRLSLPPPSPSLTSSPGHRIRIYRSRTRRRIRFERSNHLPRRQRQVTSLLPSSQRKAQRNRSIRFLQDCTRSRRSHHRSINTLQKHYTVVQKNKTKTNKKGQIKRMLPSLYRSLVTSMSMSYKFRKKERSEHANEHNRTTLYLAPSKSLFTLLFFLIHQSRSDEQEGSSTED
jgi:hypothetical protein